MEARDEKEENEIHWDRVYSPPADTREGKEKKARREKVEKAGKLEERWQMMRECKLFLEENSGTWERRTEEERKRIEKEDKQTRLDIVEMKRKKYGKAGNKKLNAAEDEKVRSETKSKQELAEIKQNLWRTYRVDGKEILAPTRPKNPPEGRKLEGKDHQYPSITDYFKNKREEKQTTAKQLQDHWELMKVCVKYIEENEDWLIANRLERSYQEEERQRMWEREERLARMRKKKSEMQRKISDKNEIGTGDEKDGESSQLDRKYKKDGKGDDPDNEMTDKTWKYWKTSYMCVMILTELKI